MFESIDQVYLINLDERVDKFESAINMFRKLGINSYVRIVPNFDKYDESVSLNKFRQSVKDSHVRCVNDALFNNYNNILIFEDDFTFNQDDLDIEKNIHMHIAECNSFIKNNEFDIMYLDNIKRIIKDSDNNTKSIIRYTSSNKIAQIVGKAYTHSYILNKNIFREFVNAQIKYRSTGNDAVSANLKCKKYMYCPGMFDQKIGIHADNIW